MTGTGPGWVRVGAEEYREGLVLLPDNVIKGWAPAGIEANARQTPAEVARNNLLLRRKIRIPVFRQLVIWARQARPGFQKRFSRTRSFQVVRSISPSTKTSPSRNPTSWARAPSGRPKTASHA